jgi:hypothetical protein
MSERLTEIGFEPFSPEAFYSGQGLADIEKVISLASGTCTERAAKIFCEAHAEHGRRLSIEHVNTFDDAVNAVRNDVRAVMLVPELHDMRKTLQRKSHYPNVAQQSFRLPNPGLHVAEPIDNRSDRSYLWSLQTLLPLVREKFGDELPFEEIVPADSTQDAAIQCSKIYGGGYCVTNDNGLKSFALRSIEKLRHIDMNWYVHRKA